jgi:hypothetical protein
LTDCAKITATVTISGSAERVLAAIQGVRGVRRSAQLAVEILRPGVYDTPYHLIPEIKDGDTRNAHHKLGLLSDQRLVDDECERRIDGLIRDFGLFTTP